MSEPRSQADVPLLEKLLLGQLPVEEADRLAAELAEDSRLTALAQSLGSSHDTLLDSLRQHQTIVDANADQLVERMLKRLHVTAHPEASETATMGLAQASPAGESIADRLEYFRILKVLGQGGMGTVYLADDTRLGRSVAIKTLKRELAANPVAKDRFLREARSAAKLRHDHIIPIYYVGEADGIPFLAMPFLEGEALDVRIKRQALTESEPLPIPEAVRIAREVAQGLAVAHRQGLIHRDIKPANIWLEAPNGRVKILDFGLARSQNEGAQLTASGAIIGTPAYMAPEQARGKPVDARADLFSLGCVLFEMLTGRRPFRGNDTMAILSSLALDNPPPPHTLNANCPQALSDLTMQLLAKDPLRRPASAEEVAKALVKFQLPTVEVIGESTPANNPWSNIDNTVPLATPAEPDASARAKPRRRRLFSYVAIAIGLAFIGLGIIFSGTIIRVANNEGELVVEVDDPNTEVVVKEGGVEIRREDNGKKRVFLVKAGKDGEVEVREPGSDTVLVMEKFKVRRGDKTVLTVTAAKLAKGRKNVDLDRKAAEYVLSIGGKARLTADGVQRDPTTVGELPRGPFELRIVDLSQNTKASDDGLANFKDCLELTHLYLQGTQVGDRSLEHLKSCKNLNRLDLTKTKVTVQGIADLKRALPNIKIEWDGDAIGPKLKPSPQLKNSIGMEFAHVPKGKAWLGGGGGKEGNREVSFKNDFYIGVYPVTQQEWQKVTGTNAAHFSRNGFRKEAVKDIADEDLNRFPVEGVSYADVEAFLAKLNEHAKDAGWTYRLPTQDEWEYACRGGPIDKAASAFHFYVPEPRNDLPPNLANYAHVGGPNRTVKAGQYPPNKLGIYDMHGLVLEWCSDAGKNAIGEDTRIARGGSWNDSAGTASSPKQFLPTVRYASLGLRVVRVRVESESNPLQWSGEKPPPKNLITGELLVHETFDDPKLAKPVKLDEPGTPIGVVDGVKVIYFVKLGEGNYASVPFGGGAADVAFVSRVRGTNAAPYAEFRFRKTPTRSSRLELEVDVDGTWQLRFVSWNRAKGEDWQLAESKIIAKSQAAEPDLASGKWFTIAIRSLGPTIEAWANGRMLVKIADAMLPDQQLPPGDNAVEIGGRVRLGGNTKLEIDYIGAWKVDSVSDANNDRRAAQWVLSIGGGIQVNESPQGIDKPDDLPGRPFQLTGVWLPANNKATDEDMANFKGCKNIRLLHLGYTAIGDQGLANFKDCKNLKVLSLVGWKITDDGLENLKDCKDLESLTLYGLKISSVGLAHFKECKKLTTLELHNMQLDAAGLAHLNDRKDLKILNLAGTSVRDADLVSFNNCPNLTYVGLAQTKVGDVGLLNFTKCKNLETIDLTETQVTDDGLEHLKRLATLRWVVAKKTKSTAEGVKKLHEALPLCKIEWDGGVIDPASSDRKAAEWVLSIGGQVQTTINNRFVDKTADLPKEPFEVTYVWFHDNQKLTAAGLGLLKDCRRLSKLHFTGSKFDEAWLANFRQSTELTAIDFGFTSIGDVGLGHFRDCTRLTTVVLTSTKINDALLDRLANCKALTLLTLDGTTVGDPGLTRLAYWTNLASLDLRHTKVTDAGMSQLKACPKLEQILLEDTKIGDKGLESLAALLAAKSIGLKKTDVTEAGVKKLAAALPACRIEWNGGVIEPKTAVVYDRRAAEWVLSIGGRVTVVQNDETRDVTKLADLPAGDCKLVSVTQGFNNKWTNAALANLAECKNLSYLELGEMRVTDEGMAHLKNLRSLTRLILANGKLTSAGLEQISELSNLTYLNLGGNAVTNADLAKFTRLQKLTSLLLDLSKVTDEGLVHMKAFKELRELGLRGTPVTNAGMVHVAELKNLTNLGLQGTRITDDGLAQLKKLDNLHFLYLDGTQVGNAGMVHLRDFKKLGAVTLKGTQITDGGIDAMIACAALRGVNLQNTKVTETGARKLAAKPSGCRVEYEGGVIEPKK